MKKLYLVIMVMLSFNFLIVHSHYNATLHKRLDNYNRWENAVLHTENLNTKDTLSAMLLSHQLNEINMALYEELLRELSRYGGIFDYCDIDLWGDIGKGLSGHMILVTYADRHIPKLAELLDTLVSRLDAEHNVKNVSYQIDVVTR